MIPLVEYGERDDRLSAIMARRAIFDEEIDGVVRSILDRVRSDGDVALADFSERFDRVRPESLHVSLDTIREAYERTDPALRSVLEEAAGNIRRFHEKQLQRSWFEEGERGVVLGQRILPIERVGLYIPGGTASYPSSLLMNAVPALVAGVPELHLVSPPGPNGLPHDLVLAGAHLLGLENVYAVGGAQAIAALANGTESIPAVDKIIGPGNAYVTAAKRMVYGRVDIDSIAGPSEIVVLADASADPEFAAADLLSQAEHDVRASAILVTPDRRLARSVQSHINAMVADLPRREIIERSLADYGACILTSSMDEAVEITNKLAPEHLELLVEEPWDMLSSIRHAGAIFLGPYSPEPVGDYFAGPNHVLPTGGTARFASALGVEDFLRKQSVIEYSEEEIRRTGPRIMTFAKAEGLEAHARAIEVRLIR